LHNMRPQGAKIVFLQFRQQTETLQGVLVASGEKDENQVSKQMLKFAQGITVRFSLLSPRWYLTDDRLNHS
jgi:aspartyl/asparaginyl-tRNA synthetase